jgi:hypothetical protein
MKSEAKQSQATAVVYLPALGCLLQSMPPTETVVRQWRSLLEGLQTDVLPIETEFTNENYRYWCHCVEFTPDHAGIQLTRVVAVTQTELNSLKVLLNQHFSEQNIQFEMVDEQLWINAKEPLPKAWHSVYNMLGTNVYFSLGNEPSHTRWFALLNEIQMLIANHSQAFSFNGLWISRHPSHWISVFTQSSIQNQYEIIFDSLDGIDFWIQQDWSKLVAWLQDTFEQLELLRQEQQHLVVFDGESSWTLERYRWRQKLKQMLKGWISS